MMSCTIHNIVNSSKPTYCNDLMGLILRGITPSLENEGWGEVKRLRFFIRFATAKAWARYLEVHPWHDASLCV